MRIRFSVLWCAVLCACLIGGAAYGQGAKKPREHYLIRMFPELKATDGVSLAHQNEIADAYGLPRLQNSAELADHKQRGYLVALAQRYGCFEVDQRIGNRKFTVPIPNTKKKKTITEDFRYLNPVPVRYLKTFSEKYCANVPSRARPFMLSSLVRTQEYQAYLAERNATARQALGDLDPARRSSHPTGYTFDISARGHRSPELIDLAKALLADKKAGILAEVIFEEYANNFHVMVHPNAPRP